MACRLCNLSLKSEIETFNLLRNVKWESSVSCIFVHSILSRVQRKDLENLDFGDKN
jgi:hypothetical protein